MSESESPDLAPTTYAVELEKQARWLDDHKAEYLAAKGRGPDAAERVERLTAFEEIRKICLDAAVPKDGNEAIYRLGYLRKILENATKIERTVKRYEAAVESYKALQEAEKKVKIHGRPWFLGRP